MLGDMEGQAQHTISFHLFFSGLGNEIKMNIDINFSITEIQVSNIDINFGITEIQVSNIDINFGITEIQVLNIDINFVFYRNSGFEYRY